MCEAGNIEKSSVGAFIGGQIGHQGKPSWDAQGSQIEAARASWGGQGSQLKPGDPKSSKAISSGSNPMAAKQVSNEGQPKREQRQKKVDVIRNRLKMI